MDAVDPDVVDGELLFLVTDLNIAHCAALIELHCSAVRLLALSGANALIWPIDKTDT